MAAGGYSDSDYITIWGMQVTTKWAKRSDSWELVEYVSSFEESAQLGADLIKFGLAESFRIAQLRTRGGWTEEERSLRAVLADALAYRKGTHAATIAISTLGDYHLSLEETPRDA